MKVLVTGGAGFIGSNFVRWWARERPGDTVVAYDALTYAGNRESLRDVPHEFVHGDIGDLAFAEETLRDHAIDVVVNFAAESHNSYAITNPGIFFRTNVVGTQTLCEAARRVGITRFHHVSTCEVYGDLALDATSPFTETSPYAPRTPYNASKAGGDHAVRAYFETFDLPITITNCANNYGPYQFPEKVIPLFATRALDDQPIPLYASTKNRREWIHVDDHCRALLAVTERGRGGEVYNIGGDNEWPNLQIVGRLLEILGKSLELIEHVKDRPGHDRRYAIDAARARAELGWAPRVSFGEGLKSTVEWYVQNRGWWERVRTGEYRTYYERNYGAR